MTQTPVDIGVERLKTARDSVAVMKHELIAVKSRCLGVTILVVEGLEDKLVYSQWIRRLRPELRYDYYVSKGKKQALQLYEAVCRDKTNLKEKVFFLIDRDFDDLAGHDPSEFLFMTDRYSTENYLVDEDTLEDILKTEFNCHGYPEIRNKIKEIFRVTYKDFLEVTKVFNFRLFVSKAIPINRIGDFPLRLNQIAIVSLNKVEPQVRDATEVISLEREPTTAEIALFNDRFLMLTGNHRYRGKFAYLFFHRWIDLLVEDHASKNTIYFKEIDAAQRARRNEIVMTSLASRSPMPEKLGEFLAAM
jgi:hypothetical protein